jgi:hypothetical protein
LHDFFFAHPSPQTPRAVILLALRSLAKGTREAVRVKLARRGGPACCGRALSVFLQPSLQSATIAALAAVFTRPPNSTRTRRMLLINDAPIRIARNSLKTNNADQF